MSTGGLNVQIVTSNAKSLQVSRGAIQLRFRKGSSELKSSQKSETRIRRESKSKQSIKSRSVSHDSSANQEDTTPLLMKSSSEVQFSDDLLDAGSLEDIREESGKVEQGTPHFQLESSPASSNNPFEEQILPATMTVVKGAPYRHKETAV